MFVEDFRASFTDSGKENKRKQIPLQDLLSPVIRLLFVGIGSNDFADVPYVRCFSGRLNSFLRRAIFERRGLRAAVHTHGIPAPAVLFFQQARPAAEGAILQNQFFMNVQFRILPCELTVL